MTFKKSSVSIVLFIIMVCNVSAQQYLDPAYIKVTNERASKIVETLELSNPAKEKVVTDIIAQQYRNLTKIQDERDAKIETLKKSGLSKEKENARIEKLKAKSGKQIDKLHKSYLNQLASELNADKIDKVKDGMTYGVLPKTYYAFQDMLPNLTEEQKDFIYKNLVEAREHAMDAGSSDEKHAWFGKYKGRINNYLSSQGYDLNKESEAWHKRIEEREKNESRQ